MKDSKTRPSRMGVPNRHLSLVLLTVQSSAYVLLLHYSRVMPVVDGRRYITSTAVFLNEVLKLAICLTIALYEHSTTVHPSLPATSLLASLTSTIFSGDSWKLVIPASLYTLSNSLQYIALSNFEASRFQVTYQLKLLTGAVFSAVVLRRNITSTKWLSLLLLFVGVFIVQFSATADPMDPDSRARLYIPRSLAEFSDSVRDSGSGNRFNKRSATYEGIEEDLMVGNPRLNANIGLLATLGACLSSGLAGVSFERVLKDSASTTSIWVRNVQLAIYSIFPALFIGVVFMDGEKIAKIGFFGGYNFTVWAAIAVQAMGGIATSFCLNYSENVLKLSAGGISIILSIFGSAWLFESSTTFTFIFGSGIVLAGTYLFLHGTHIPDIGSYPRAPPIRIQNFEKLNTSFNENSTGGGGLSPPNDFSIKLPTSPLISESAALSTSRPGSPSPHHSRAHSSRGTYFAKQHQDN